jgi:hypothetical protein
MEHSALMGMMNGAGYFRHKGRGGFRARNRAIPGYSLRQAFSLDPLHRQVRLTLMLADFENRNDVRVLKPCGGFGFEAQAPETCFHPNQTWVQDFQSYRAIELRLLRVIDHPHPASANFVE